MNRRRHEDIRDKKLKDIDRGLRSLNYWEKVQPYENTIKKLTVPALTQMAGDSAQALKNVNAKTDPECAAAWKAVYVLASQR